MTLIKSTNQNEASYIVVNNSLYLGTNYAKRDLSAERIETELNAFDATSTGSPVSCSVGTYCAGDELKINDASTTFQTYSNYFGECKLTPIRALSSSTVKCPVAEYSCLTLADLAFSNVCKNPDCTEKIAAELYQDVLSSKSTPDNPLDNANCLESVWVSF